MLTLECACGFRKGRHHIISVPKIFAKILTSRFVYIGALYVRSRFSSTLGFTLVSTKYKDNMP